MSGSRDAQIILVEEGDVEEQDGEWEEEEDLFTKTHRAASCFEDQDEFAADMEPVSLDEDTFGMSVCSLTRDTYHLAKNGCSCARITRLVTSLFLVIVTISIQIALLHYVKHYVSARAVHETRRAYSKYEEHVYGCVTTKTNCYLTENLKHRGKADFYPGDKAATAILYTEAFSDGDRDEICHIPLSQPKFFSLVLTIWVLTCFQELKKGMDLGWIVMMLPRTQRMDDSMEEGDDGMTIVGMTMCMKLVLLGLTFIPRIGITIYLGWVGMRWLLATTAFSDLILNAVALEFVLCIKEVIYAAVMPTRSHYDLTKTLIVPHPRRLTAAWFNFTGSVSLLGVAVFIVWIYMRHLQQVLPDYNWDVHGPCELYINREYCLGKACLEFGEQGTPPIG